MFRIDPNSGAPLFQPRKLRRTTHSGSQEKALPMPTSQQNLESPSKSSFSSKSQSGSSAKSVEVIPKRGRLRPICLMAQFNKVAKVDFAVRIKKNQDTSMIRLNGMLFKLLVPPVTVDGIYRSVKRCYSKTLPNDWLERHDQYPFEFNVLRNVSRLFRELFDRHTATVQLGVKLSKCISDPPRIGALYIKILPDNYLQQGQGQNHFRPFLYSSAFHAEKFGKGLALAHFAVESRAWTPLSHALYALNHDPRFYPLCSLQFDLAKQLDFPDASLRSPMHKDCSLFEEIYQYGGKENRGSYWLLNQIAQSSDIVKDRFLDHWKGSERTRSLTNPTLLNSILMEGDFQLLDAMHQAFGSVKFCRFLALSYPFYFYLKQCEKGEIDDSNRDSISACLTVFVDAYCDGASKKAKEKLLVYIGADKDKFNGKDSNSWLNRLEKI